MLALISEISNVTQFWYLIEVLIFKFFSQAAQVCISGSTSSYIIFKGGEQWSLSGTSPSRTHYRRTVSTIPSSMGYQVDQGMAQHFANLVGMPQFIICAYLLLQAVVQKYCLLFFAFICPLPDPSFSQMRWMMPRHTWARVMHVLGL